MALTFAWAIQNIRTWTWKNWPTNLYICTIIQTILQYDTTATPSLYYSRPSMWPLQDLSKHTCSILFQGLYTTVISICPIYAHLSKATLQQHTSTKKAQTMKRKIDKLETRISKLVETEGVEIPEDQDEIFRKLMKDEETFVDLLPEGSPQRIMWEQQSKAAKTTARGMRWHPAILRLCRALHAKSTSAYNLLRSSGFIRLPHENTLYNYTHFTDYVKPGNKF